MADTIPIYIEDKFIPARRDRAFITALFGGIEQVLGMGDLVVSPGGGYVTSTSAGHAVVQGDDTPGQDLYEVYNDAAVTKTHTPDATNPKIDRIVYRVYDSDELGSGSDLGQVEIVPGSPVAGADLENPAHWPAIPNTAIPLARVRVPASGGSIAAADIAGERPKVRGNVYVPTEESRTNTAYGLMPTPDRVRSLVVPPGAKIRLSFLAAIKESVDDAAFAAIFLGANQLKIPDGESANPVVQETQIFNDNAGQPGAGVYKPLVADARGLISNSNNATPYAGEVTTGMVFGLRTTASGGSRGGACEIFVAAGTYDISVQFKAASGNVTVKDRRLFVESVRCG